MHAFLEKVDVPKPLGKPRHRHDIGLHPVVGLIPALSHHALRCKISNHLNMFITDELFKRIQLVV